MNKNKSKMQQILFNFYKKSLPHTVFYSTIGSIIYYPIHNNNYANYINNVIIGMFIGITYPVSFPIFMFKKYSNEITNSNIDLKE